MENDELMAAWSLLGKQLERQSALQWQQLRERRLERVRGSLWPLRIGQMLQILLLGVPFMLLAALLWHHAGQASAPLPPSVLLGGIVVHAYGVAVTVMAGCTLGMTGRIDYAAPVLDIQKQLGKVRRLYIVNGMVAGLPWWFLWVPIAIVLSALAGVDLHARSPETVWAGLGIGALGLVATAAFHRWSRDPRRPSLARAMDDGVTGASLRKAKLRLEELRAFERD